MDKKNLPKEKDIDNNQKVPYVLNIPFKGL